MSIVKIENLVKKYGDITAVSGISFEIEKGEIFGLLGPNGAGKSTTISMLSGLLKPTEGKIFINNKDVIKHPMEAKKVLGLVPQDIALYPTLTALENLNFWGKMYGLSGKLLKERISEVLEIAGLEERKNEKIQGYSGGMKRRINIAAALLHRPEILIMDEPTVGIDPQSRNHILESVKKLNETGMTVIYTSHYMEEIEYLCKRIGIIDHGKLMALGDKDELKLSLGTDEELELELSMVTPTVEEKIKAVTGVKRIAVEDRKIMVISDGNNELVQNIISSISKLNIKIIAINIKEVNLESIFLNLTGRALRD